MNASCLLHILMLVDCSIQFGLPQRRLYRQISFLSTEQHTHTPRITKKERNSIYLLEEIKPVGED